MNAFTSIAHNQPDLTPELAKLILAHAETASGIKVDPAKTDFVRLRVASRLQALGLPDFEAYNLHLTSDPTGPEVRKLVEALATHTTSFFRETRHYDWLNTTGFDLLTEGRRTDPLVIWSAAASLGAELYSAGILLQERKDTGQSLPQWKLIGTDISDRILKRARSATYTQDEISGLSPDRMRRFVLRSREAHKRYKAPLYRLVPELRAKAVFRQANLQTLQGLDSFTADVAFLRNVLIYFTPEVQKTVVRNVISRLRPGGFLFTGHAEPLSDTTGMQQVQSTIYRKM